MNPDHAPENRAIGTSPARSLRAWSLLLTVMVLGLIIDLGSKSVAFRMVADAPVVLDRDRILSIAREDPRKIGMVLPAHAPVRVIPGILDLTLVLNPGAVFGIGPGQRWFFVAFTLLALGLGLWMFAAWTNARDRSAHVAIGLLLSGGLGNLYDRLQYGCVRDFLHPLPGWTFPFQWKPFGGSGEIWPYVSNLADLFLLIGIGMLVIHLWRRDHERGAVAG
ncbi:MAG: signal peptidase II [Phycisphaerae bacterium]|nr:signal peptidase II [Phycisphaerae bacterium]